MEAIEAEGLTKRFGDLVAVDHVDFQVEWGEVFGFLGPNGAGKTTTINMLITIMKPTEGTAKVAGYEILTEPDKIRRKIAVVFQDPTLDRQLTGWENLWIHGRIYGVPPAKLRGRIAELLEFVGLERWAKTQVKYYSGGMMRRLEIARALLYNPEILFLDEPTLGLDPQTRAQIWEYIQMLKRDEGTTIFLTTHYMEEAERLCDRVAIIDHGKIVSIGSVKELKDSVGGEVIYVKVDPYVEIQSFARAVKEHSFAEKIQIVNGRTIGIFTKDAPGGIPLVFEVAQSLGVGVAEVAYHSPTLEEVFLKFTGRRLRDETAGFFEHARMVVRSRWRR